MQRSDAVPPPPHSASAAGCNPTTRATSQAPPFISPLAAMNWVGSMIAMLGTGLYSLAKQKASDDAKRAKAAAAQGKAA